MEKLKHCPICGYEPCKWLYEAEDKKEHEVEAVRDAMTHKNYIYCPNCGCYFWFPARILAASGFNSRHKVTSAPKAADLTDKCGSCIHAEYVGNGASVRCKLRDNIRPRSHVKCKFNYEKVGEKNDE